MKLAILLLTIATVSAQSLGPKVTVTLTNTVTRPSRSFGPPRTRESVTTTRIVQRTQIPVIDGTNTHWVTLNEKLVSETRVTNAPAAKPTTAH